MAVQAHTVRRTGGRRPGIASIDMVDFTGGLNLRDDRFDLRPNESWDLDNVDVDGAGGFRLRKGFTTEETIGSGSDRCRSIILNQPDSQVLYHVGGTVYYDNAGTWTSIGVTGVTAGPCRGVVHKSKLYIQKYATGDAVTWDGSTLVTLDEPSVDGWQNDYASPSGVSMPRARCIVIRNNFAVIGNTSEDASGYVKYGCRLRWSHPADAGSWREDDYIDINHGMEGDEITALAKFRDQLIVFKNNSMYAVYGNTADDLVVTELAVNIGTPSQETVAETPFGVFFLSRQEGVMLLSEDGLRPVSDKLRPIWFDGTVNMADIAVSQVGWVNGRLWVSVPHSGSSTPNYTYVLDPETGNGAWTRYSRGFGPFRTSFDSGGRTELAGDPTGTRILSLETQVGVDTVGSTATHIDSYYRTAFLDGGAPTRKKRWKRPDFVLRGSTESELLVEVSKDFDPSTAPRAFTLTQGADGTGLVWDDGVGGGGDWDSDVWARSDGDFDVIRRGASIGNARAISLKIIGPRGSSNKDWGVNAVTLKFIPRPVRG
jgi:hypothetical protein